MQDAPSWPTDSREDLAAVVADLRVRVAALEARLAGLPAESFPSDAVTAAAEDRPAVAGTAATAAPPATMPAVGRAFLVLAGAFLLRALTDARVLVEDLGVALGLLYVLVILAMADRAARRGGRHGAILLGLAAVVTGYPLVWETTTQLTLLTSPLAAVATVVLTGLGLAIAVRHRLRTLAWAFTIAALATVVGLAWASTTPCLFGALAVGLGLAAVGLARACGWWGPRWLAAAGANLLVLVLVALALRQGEPLPGRPHPAAAAVLALALALPGSYLAAFFTTTLRGRGEAGIFEILQSLGALVAGLGGAILVQRASGGEATAIGGAALVAAVGVHALAFAFVRGRQGRRRNFFYFAWLGLALVLVGSAAAVPGAVLPFLWGGLGVAAAATGGHFDRWTLRLHSAAYLAGAAMVSGLPAAVTSAFVTAPGAEWHRLGLPGTTAWALALVSYVLLVVTQRDRVLPAWRRLPRFILAGLVLLGAGTQVVGWLVTATAGVGAGDPAAHLAAVRTVVLAVTALALAAASRQPHLVEMAWFVNPLLVLTGLKILLEDLRHGTPAALFLGFACFGAALIVAPRLRLRPPVAAPAPEETP